MSVTISRLNRYTDFNAIWLGDTLSTDSDALSDVYVS